jgi:predicted phosphodiesterase
MRYLCISDIHGDLEALRAILATAERKNFHGILLAGDVLFPAPHALLTDKLWDARSSVQPLEVWRRLRAASATIVQGVTDRALATLDPKRISPSSEEERRRMAAFIRLRQELGDLVLRELSQLPTHERVVLEDARDLLLVHGSPADPFEAMGFELEEDELNALVADDPADVVICGMSHVPFDRVIADVRVINVGSVGDAPDNRSPHEPPVLAHAAWLDSTPSGIEVDAFSVPLTP